MSKNPGSVPNLSAKQRELLERRLLARAAPKGRASGIPRRAPGAANPLSFAQQRLWFLNALEPGTTQYHLSAVHRIHGDLNREALEKGLQTIIERHEILRTTLQSIDGTPVQTIQNDVAIDLPFVDLMNTPADAREAGLEEWLEGEIARPFDLAGDLMLRGALCRLANDEHVFLVVMHHIASDGWSMDVLLREIAASYEAHHSQADSNVRELPIQYADFAVWQREWFTGPVLQKQLTYWRNQLTGAPPVLEIPTEKPRHVVTSSQSGTRMLALSPELSHQLEELSRGEEATLFMTLLAAFQVLLGKLAGTKDVVVGSPIAGRNREEIEGLIGFFVNTLVLRGDLSGDATFRDILRRVRESTLEAYANQDLPFEKLVEELHPERAVNRTPLFQHFFNMLNMAGESLQLPGLRVERIAAPETDSKFELTLYVRPRPEGLVFLAVYNAELFSDERIRELLAQYKELLSAIAKNPDERIDRYSLVTSAAKTVLPDPTQPLSSECGPPAHQQFAEQARKTPDRLAVVDPTEQWTYGELEARSNQLAHRLVQSGVEPGGVVAIYAHRDASVVWAMLAVLKAGGAFLMLDPGQPASRLVECLKFAQPTAWLQLDSAGPLSDSLNEFLATLPELPRLTIPNRSQASAMQFLCELPTSAPDITLTAEHPAYIAFTSGSTGAPKGILGTHGPLSHFLAWHIPTFGLNDSDRYSLLSGLGHDPLLRDIFTPLVTGATLHIPDSDDIGSERLAEWMQREKITVVHLTPAMGKVLAGGAGRANQEETQNEPVTGRITIPALRMLFFGGDRLTRRDIELTRAWAPHAGIVNFYGTTETPQAIAWQEVPATFGVSDVNSSQENAWPEHEAPEAEVVPLGRGIADVQLLLLNGAGKLCGIGEVGEIHVRTPHLSRGYVNDDAMTRERFLENSFVPTAVARQTGDRMYKTGDLGRYRLDGTVEFIGRADDQVKIRGYRVEPAEIESALRQHADVGEVLIVVHEPEAGDRRLAAYVVPRNGHAPESRDLRGFLKERLPEFMVPSAYVVLERLPLTPNGKIDRAALPSPDSQRRDAEPQDDHGLPQTEAEQVIAEVWRELLKIEHVTVFDNFLDLGGHSLLGMEVIAHVKKRSGVEIKPRELMFQSLGQIAAICTERKNAPPESEPEQSGLIAGVFRKLKAAVGGSRGDR